MTDTGGPAFPVPFSLGSNAKEEGPVFADCYGNGGMTLRDYFAAKAMAAILSGSHCPEERYDAMTSQVARLSYLAADAMLKERTNETPS